MKIHGYKIKLTAFLPAEPFNIDELTEAQQKFAALRDWLNENQFYDVEMTTAPGSKIARIPDEPKAAEAQTLAGKITLVEDLNFPPAYESVSKTADGKYTHGREMPPIPAHLDATKRRT